MLPAIIGEEVGQFKLLGTDPGKTLVKDDDIDSFLGGNAASQRLGNTAHSLTLTLLTDPKGPVHDIVLDYRELGQTVGCGGFQRHYWRFTQDFFTADTGEPIT